MGRIPLPRTLSLVFFLTACMNPNVGSLTADNAYGQGNCQTANSIVERQAEAGFPWAQSRLGQANLSGNCRPQNYAEAFKWLRRAASYESKTDWENGRSLSVGPNGFFNTRATASNASLSLALIYRHGLGVEKDMVQSWLWLNRSVTLSEKNDSQYIQALESHMSKEDVQKARDMSLTWIPPAPNQH